jgi:hypothetical protein
MKNYKRNRVLPLAVLCIGLTLGMVALGSCSTFPTTTVNAATLSYDILGYVGAGFYSYEAAFTAAKEIFPETDAVVVVTAVANDNIIPQKKVMGYYAVKFKQVEANKKILGIF